MYRFRVTLAVLKIIVATLIYSYDSVDFSAGCVDRMGEGGVKRGL